MKTKIIYYSRTGNIEKFIQKLNYKNIEIIKDGLKVNEPFILIVSTIYFGEVPIEYKKFLKNNHKYLIGVSGSGNRNWGKNFAVAANIISEKFKVPLISKFDLSGNLYDVKKFINGVERIENEQK